MSVFNLIRGPIESKDRLLLEKSIKQAEELKKKLLEISNLKD